MRVCHHCKGPNKTPDDDFGESGYGTNPNPPSRLRFGRYRVITGPSATLGPNTATVQHLSNSLKSLGAAVPSPHRASDRGDDACWPPYVVRCIWHGVTLVAS